MFTKGQRIFSISTLTLSLALSGCGGGGGGDGSGTTPRNATTSDIVGTWDVSTEEANNTTDVYYVKINSDGTYVDYDFDGDSFDQGDDCYYRWEGTYENLGDGDFSFDGEEAIHIERSGNNLIISADDMEDLSAKPANKTEDDFSPLCQFF